MGPSLILLSEWLGWAWETVCSEGQAAVLVGGHRAP